MTDKKQIIIDTNKYFVELIDEGGGTVDYTVMFPERLLIEIIKQNKQLARKTQECEKLEEKYEALKLENEEGYEIVDELKQECEELKEKLRELELKNTTLQNRNQQLDGSMTECEELKEKLYQIEDVVKPINEQLPEDNVIRQIMLILNDCNRLEPSRYRKALEEIEKHIESYKKQCHIPNNCVDNRLCSTCFLGGGNELGENILDIINKAKGGNKNE